MTIIPDDRARVLMQFLATEPRFRSVPPCCQEHCNPGMSDVPSWRIWTHRATTTGQLRIEDELEYMVTPQALILHIGVGNSSLGKRIAPRAASTLGTTLFNEELVYARNFNIINYNVIICNKFTEAMDRIEGPFDFIIDTNPTGFCCCLFHFSKMISSYMRLLRQNGGVLLTDRQGLSWVCDGNHPDWAFEWADWLRLGQLLSMPVERITESVYSLRRTSNTRDISLIGLE